MIKLVIHIREVSWKRIALLISEIKVCHADLREGRGMLSFHTSYIQKQNVLIKMESLKRNKHKSRNT